MIPTVLVNGCEGVGTGFSTTVPSYNPREIVANIRRLMDGLEPTPMVSDSNLWSDLKLATSKTLLASMSLLLQQPWYKGFTGTIAQTAPHQYTTYGNVARLNDTTIEITELPVGSWPGTYLKNVLVPMLLRTDEAGPSIT